VDTPLANFTCSGTPHAAAAASGRPISGSTYVEYDCAQNRPPSLHRLARDAPRDGKMAKLESEHGLGGLVVPFIGIKVLDVLVVALGLAP